MAASVSVFGAASAAPVVRAPHALWSVTRAARSGSFIPPHRGGQVGLLLVPPPKRSAGSPAFRAKGALATTPQATLTVGRVKAAVAGESAAASASGLSVRERRGKQGSLR